MRMDFVQNLREIYSVSVQYKLFLKVRQIDRSYALHLFQPLHWMINVRKTHLRLFALFGQMFFFSFFSRKMFQLKNR